MHGQVLENLTCLRESAIVAIPHGCSRRRKNEWGMNEIEQASEQIGEVKRVKFDEVDGRVRSV
jgi:hypothetical protein